MTMHIIIGGGVYLWGVVYSILVLRLMHRDSRDTLFRVRHWGFGFAWPLVPLLALWDHVVENW